ncbi:MAG: 50S ribosomal protein L5 [Candidatus Doudnabacteria bacterium]|nr:50S ribosomal protein L5 [Candidatus Doudnabacteria bacterium]
MTRLLQQFRTKILPELRQELKFANDLAVPRVEKIMVNAGVGKLLQQQPKSLDEFIKAMAKITGQQPQVTRAKKAISGFKIRQGQAVGLMVTLRGKRMYDFLDKLINATLPRSRDFRGLSKKGFDRHGNYSLGLRDHMVFPEMAQEEIGTGFGLEVTIATTAKTDEAAYKLLKHLGFPFKENLT